MEKNNNNGFSPRTCTRENPLFYSITNEYEVLYRCSWVDWVCIKVVPFIFFSKIFSFCLFSLSLSLSLSLIPFPMHPPFLIYLYLHHIFTIHFYLASLLFWYLLPFTFETGGGRDLLSCDLYCSGHFLINAADKAVVYHLTRMQ